MKHQRAIGALIMAGALGLTACGSGESASSPAPTKTIDVSMTDNEFTPNSIEVQTGETVTFRFTNEGKVDHEAILGSEAEQADHESQMMDGDGDGPMHEMDDMDGMDHGGSDTEAISVEPGDTGTLTQTFEAAGTLILGCHEPGHYESGMKATIIVT